MTSSRRIEDLLPEWRKLCAVRISDLAATVTDGAMATLPPDVDFSNPGKQAAISETINGKVSQVATEELLPQCLGWLSAQALGPTEKDVGRVRAESTIALRLRLPTFGAHLPPPTCRIPYGSWTLPAAAGAALGALALTPISMLLLEKREPGLLAGCIMGAALTVSLLAWLAERPSLLSALQKIAGAASLGAGLAGAIQIFRGRSSGLLKTAGGIAACWTLLLLVRPKLTGPTRDECQVAVRPQVERLVAHAVDLVLTLCWFHPDRGVKPVDISTGPPIPASVADALGVLWAVSEDGEGLSQHLPGAVRALLQRVREQGYEWKTVENGSRYDASLEDHFECFGIVESGTTIEMLEPARVWNNKLDKPGQVRAS